MAGADTNTRQSDAGLAGLKPALALYGQAPRGVRAFLRGRVLLSDLEFIERHVPASGRIVDLGCGHGLFANLMALRGPGREVIGIDLDAGKIAIAEGTTGARANIRFIHGDAMESSLPACEAVTIVDVLYLMPAAAQRELLAGCARLLKPGGLLVWKAQERRPRWKYAWTYFQELVTTSIGLTRGKRGRFHFMDREEALAAITAAGLTGRAIPMHTRRPYTDILYLGQKPGAPPVSGKE
ncbi:MAG: class I SAM-dependent methyltransferase [Thermoleophilia bacterium]